MNRYSNSTIHMKGTSTLYKMNTLTRINVHLKAVLMALYWIRRAEGNTACLLYRGDLYNIIVEIRPPECTAV